MEKIDRITSAVFRASTSRPDLAATAIAAEAATVGTPYRNSSRR
jgi:hypothetical protein